MKRPIAQAQRPKTRRRMMSSSVLMRAPCPGGGMIREQLFGLTLP